LEERLLASHGLGIIGLLPPRRLDADQGERHLGRCVYATKHSQRIIGMREALALMHAQYDNLSDETAQSEPGYNQGTEGDRLAVGTRLCSPEFRHDADQGVTTATASGVNELPTLVDYVRRQLDAMELMADIFQAHVNSPLARSLPACRAAHRALRYSETPQPVLETVYEGLQVRDSLGMNPFGTHFMLSVDEGDIVCVYPEPVRCGDGVPHQFVLVTSVRPGVDSDGHSATARRAVTLPRMAEEAK
jgi:hypothetical protein